MVRQVLPSPQSKPPHVSTPSQPQNHDRLFTFTPTRPHHTMQPRKRRADNGVKEPPPTLGVTRAHGSSAVIPYVVAPLGLFFALVAGLAVRADRWHPSPLPADVSASRFSEERARRVVCESPPSALATSAREPTRSSRPRCCSAWSRAWRRPTLIRSRCSAQPRGRTGTRASSSMLSQLLSPLSPPRLVAAHDPRGRCACASRPRTRQIRSAPAATA